MADLTKPSEEIKDTDIVFDCPFCGKSLAIDYRGAGLIIPCSDCGRDVDVPIPEGMELGDLDSSDEEQEIRILNLRRSVATAEARILELENELAAANTENSALEKGGDSNANKLEAILESVDIIRQLIGDLSKTLGRITEIAQSD